jgi:hypothetical protein
MSSQQPIKKTSFGARASVLSTREKRTVLKVIPILVRTRPAFQLTTTVDVAFVKQRISRSGGNYMAKNNVSYDVLESVNRYYNLNLSPPDLTLPQHAWALLVAMQKQDLLSVDDAMAQWFIAFQLFKPVGYDPIAELIQYAYEAIPKEKK